MVMDQFNHLGILDTSVILSVQLSKLHNPILEDAVDQHGHTEISGALESFDSYDVLPVLRECLRKIVSDCTEGIQILGQPVRHGSEEEVLPFFGR